MDVIWNNYIAIKYRLRLNKKILFCLILSFISIKMSFRVENKFIKISIIFC
jgi:hypothetical protein